MLRRCGGLFVHRPLAMSFLRSFAGFMSWGSLSPRTQFQIIPRLATRCASQCLDPPSPSQMNILFFPTFFQPLHLFASFEDPAPQRTLQTDPAPRSTHGSVGGRHDGAGGAESVPRGGVHLARRAMGERGRGGDRNQKCLFLTCIS